MSQKAPNAEMLSPKRRNVIFLNLMITCVAAALMSTGTSTALAPIVADLGVEVSLAQWVTSGYSLAFAVVMPLTAFIVTRFPSKPLYLISVSLYAAASFVCAFAPGFACLMAGRVTQACANGIISNLTQVSILTLYDEGSRGKAMGWFGLSQGAAVVLGPTVGGLLIDTIGWRAIFVGVALLCLLSAVMGFFVLRNLLQTALKPFDPLSFALSVVAFGGITLGLGNVVSHGFAPWVVASMASGTAAGVFFALRQLGQAEPFLKVQLFGNVSFRKAVIASMLLYACMLGPNALLPLYVQMSMGQPAVSAGLVILPGAVAMAAVSPVMGRLYDKHGIRILCFASAACLMLANAGTCLPFANESLVGLALLNVIRCLGVGAVQMPLTTWANSVLDSADMPHGTALLTSLRNVAGALAVALLVGVFEAFGSDAVGLAWAFGIMTVLPVLMALCVLRTKAK